VAQARTPIRTRAGQRRHRVTLQSSETTKDVLGGLQSGDYTPFGTDQAAIAEIPFIVNGSEHGMLYDVTIRYRADVVTEFRVNKKRVRVVAADQTYDVLEIENPEHRNIELIMHCAPA